ncbi:hypothetical protein AB0L57_18310 [Nocardia sp. NPDC052254]|uniref:hypothetical protein n=1 Tax=Nocardia sp. NPDC052254 TaxID=3155681 RepID=UPI003435E7D5
MTRHRNPGTAHPVLAIFGVLFLLGIIITYWYVIAIVAGLALAIYLLRRADQERNETRRKRAWYAAQISQRADYEHQQFLAGNPQGLYGQYPPAVDYRFRP